MYGGVLTPSQAAYVFHAAVDGEQAVARPSKRRKVAKKVQEQAPAEERARFPPLLSGAETAAAAQIRGQLFEASWSHVHARIQVGSGAGCTTSRRMLMPPPAHTERGEPE